MQEKEKKINKFIDEDSSLLQYKFYLEQLLRSKEHILSENDEQLISLLTKDYGNFSTISDILKDSAINYGTVINDEGKEVEITSGNYRNLMKSKNRDLRKETYNKMYSSLEQFKNVFSNLLISSFENSDSIAKVRKYKTTFFMNSFSSNVPKEVNDNLYKVVNKRLDVYRKYYKIIKNKLKLDEIYFYDISTNLIDYDKNYSIEEAKKLVINALKYLGEDYIEIIKKEFDENWVDFCTYKGKTSGCYEVCDYLSNPLVFLNYNFKLEDVSGLSHESGHAVHSYLSNKNNKFVDAEYDLFVAEVASLTNEILLSNYIVNNSKSKEEKAASIYNLIDIIQNNLFDAALEGEFENILHKRVNDGESISIDDLNDTIYNLRKKYYGDTVKLDDYVKYTWIRRSHYYRPFYLYQYAVGVSAACFAAKKIIDGDKTFIENYKKFLKSGSSKYPVLLLKDAGIDVTGEEVFNSAIDYFDSLLDKFDELTK